MAHFVRQKRQSRFYWAELGFMALGLLGLQPSLFTNLILGSQPRSNPFHSTLQNQPFDPYRDLSATHLASYYPTQSSIGLPAIAQGWPHYTPPTYGQNPASGQPTYGQPTYGQLQQNPYAQPFQQLNAHSQTVPTTGLYAQQNYTTPSAFNSQVPQYAQYSSTPQLSMSYGGQNQPTYFAQANNGYSWPGAANGDRWPYNALTPRSSQQSLFESGYGSINDVTGRANTASSSQSYGYPSSSAKPNAWQRYQPDSSMYR